MNDYDKLVLPAREIREGDLTTFDGLRAVAAPPHMMSNHRIGLRRVSGKLTSLDRDQATIVYRPKGA